MNKYHLGRACPVFLLFLLLACCAISSTPAIIVEEIHPFERTPDAPNDKLVKGPDGNYYGTSSSGGRFNYGAIFRFTPDGKFTLLHSFQPYGNPIGYSPNSGLTVGNDGNLYGSTS